MALEPSCKFELEQHRAHHRRRGFGHPYEIVEQYGSWPEQTCDARAVAGIGLMRQRIIVRFAQLDRPPHDRLDRIDDIGRACVSVAPCLMRSLVPAARGSSGEPGTANTSRPRSAA